MFSKSKDIKDPAFEESLGEEWSRDLDIVEVPLGNKPLFYLGAAIFLAAAVFLGRILYLNVYRGEVYTARAEANLTQYQKIPAPRGIIYDRNDKILAENRVVFTATLDTKEFLNKRELQEETIEAIETTLYIPRYQVWSLIEESGEQDFIAPIVLSGDISQSQLVQLKGLDLPTIRIESNFQRKYAGGPIFSSVVGYIGRVSANDLKGNENLSGEDFIGKSGAEAYYDTHLRGKPGIVVRTRDARGKVLSEDERSRAEIGQPLNLTIDGEFQEYFYWRMLGGLASLGRRIGVGLAINPQNGEILALINLPGFDNNLLAGEGRNREKVALLTSGDKPLFNRAISGFYSPGSTIKPLVGVAALKEGVISSERQIFSPGFLDVPNPYDPDSPTRYLDWRYQGKVDLSSAIAKSSNVYFYTVGGGSPPQVFAGKTFESKDAIKGLGINRLREWWERFQLGKLTGIDLPGEAEGFLPSARWKEEKTGNPWLLGDTYNVSIGQGDLLLTPLQLLNYISAIANGGTIYKLVVNADLPHPEILADLSYLGPEIEEVQKGMREAVTALLGTAHLLDDLGFPIAAKTGTVQVRGGAQENAIFVGFAPFDPPAGGPQIAILVLVENAVEGSLNTVPIAKDVLNWYYWNRVVTRQ